MGDRLDRLRSLVRSAAEGAAGALGQAAAVSRIREAVREVRERRVRIPERQLARAVLRAGTVAEASVRTRDGHIEIVAELESGRTLRFSLTPQQARFAPRGAKEIVFDVEPPEATLDGKVRDVTGLIASQVARALWGPMLSPSDEGEVDAPGLVDREGGTLRVDLRTCPRVRAAQSGGAPFALAMELLSIEGFEVDAQGLALRLALPQRR